MKCPASRRAALATGCLVALACGPAGAINDMFAKDAPITRMTDDDFRIASGVMRKALDEGQDGKSYDWNNPKTSAAGTITPTNAFERQGMRCRGAKFTIKAGGVTSQSAWNLCKTPQGWKVAEGR
ncbi:MAG: RT0821/Lpp0805 family surface protein [Usitatibacter sp.]